MGQVHGRKGKWDMDKYLLHKIMELLVCAEGGCRSRGFRGGEARQALLGKFGGGGGANGVVH